MRLIDADELKSAFPRCDNSKPVLVASVRATINHMPTIEPERKTGKWVFKDGTPVNRKLKMSEEAFCDQCEEMAPGYPFWECDLMLTSFCPKCGAAMEEIKNE